MHERARATAAGTLRRAPARTHPTPVAVRGPTMPGPAGAVAGFDLAGLPIHSPSPVHEVLREAGRPLGPSTLAFFSDRFGHDFRDVRLHDDARATASADALSARAYTVGSHIVLGTNSGRPDTPDRTKVLAHELSHVIQQREGAPVLDRSLTVGPSDDPVERAADEAAEAVLRGQRLTATKLAPGGVGGRIQRAVSKVCNPPSMWFAMAAATNPALVPSAVAAAAAFGTVAEAFISLDVVARTGTAPGNFYWDNPLAGPIDPAYVDFIITKNPWLGVIDRAAISIAQVARPDDLLHQPPITQFEEVKPDSVAGRAAGRTKVRALNAFYTGFHLPYAPGVAYVPRPPFVIVSSHLPVAGSPFIVTFEVFRDRSGLLVYDICVETDWLVAAIEAIVFAVLVILAIIALGAIAPVAMPAGAPAFAANESGAPGGGSRPVGGSEPGTGSPAEVTA